MDDESIKITLTRTNWQRVADHAFDKGFFNFSYFITDRLERTCGAPVIELELNIYRIHIVANAFATQKENS